MIDQNILILSQVIFKGFIECEHRLPTTDLDAELMETSILKTYKSALLAQNQISKLK